jgi:branched-chain amino acid transport system ATP-binding protein
MPGEIHGLIGPNGAGKSTLIGQIAGQIAPDSGTVHLLGRDVTGLSVAARARLGLGRTFQVTSVCLEFTALQNAVLALIGHRRGAWGFLRPAMTDPRVTGPAMETLAQFDLDDRADTPAGALSHGERRQLELAMAFALEPRCLLLDEPMAGLGAGGVPALSGILERLSARCPMLLIEHDMDAVFRLADRISVLAEGRVIFEGTADEVRASPLVRQTYLGEAA